MKAVQYSRGGAAASVINLAEVTKPEPKADQILVKVTATAVTPTDTVSRGGSNVIVKIIEGLVGGSSIPGDVFVGVVEKLGAEVTNFKIGDRVFGSLAPNTGTHSEYVVVKAHKVVAHAPSSLTDAQVASLVDGPLTANAFLQKIAKLEKGQSVLVNGASGSVGSAAVQIAKHLGAHVTGVCSTDNVEFVKSLGAESVIDYKQQDFTKLDQKFDVIFDTVWKSSYQKCKNIMNAEAIFMTTGPTLEIVTAYLATRFTKQKAVMGATGPFWKQSELEFIADLAEQGILQPIVDSEYDFTKEGMIAAHDRVDTGRKVGSVVVVV